MHQRDTLKNLTALERVERLKREVVGWTGGGVEREGEGEYID